MTISRPARRRWPAVAAAAAGGVLAGLLLGVALGGGGDETDPEQAIRDTRSKITQAAGVLEVALVEYSESVSGGRVTSPAEYRGARAAVARSRALYLEARPVVALIDPTAAREADAGYARLSRAIVERSPAGTVTIQTTRLENLLRELP